MTGESAAGTRANSSGDACQPGGGSRMPQSQPALHAGLLVRVDKHRVGAGGVDGALCTAVRVLAEHPERRLRESIAIGDDIAAGRAAEQIADLQPSGPHFGGQEPLELAEQAVAVPLVSAAVLRHRRQAEPGHMTQRVIQRFAGRAGWHVPVGDLLQAGQHCPVP